MSVDKKIKYNVQGGVKNYLGKQKEVKAPLKWQSSPDHPKTELAYITEAEKDLLVKKDLHGSLQGGVNRGPSGIMSLNGYGSIDSSGRDVGMSGAATSDAEAGRNTANTRAESPSRNLPPGVRDKALQGYRDAFINAGGGQKVNAGFFGGKYNDTVSAMDIASAKAARNNPNNRFAKAAYKNTRGRNFGGLGSLLMGALGLFTGIPGLGLAFSKKGMNFLNKKFRGVNPDGTTRTQAQYEQSMYDKRQQNRVTKLLKAKNRGYNQIGFGDFTKKTVDFTPNQQALLDDLIAQGYGPTTLDADNPAFQNDLGNPDMMNLNDVQSIVEASQVPQGIPFNANTLQNEKFDPNDISTWYDTHPATGEAVMTPSFKEFFQDTGDPLNPRTVYDSYEFKDTGNPFKAEAWQRPYSYDGSVKEGVMGIDVGYPSNDLMADASAPGNNFLYNTGNPYKDNLYNEDGEYDPYGIKGEPEVKEIATT